MGVTIGSPTLSAGVGTGDEGIGNPGLAEGNGALLIEGVGNGAALDDGNGALVIEGVGNGGEGMGALVIEGVGNGAALDDGNGALVIEGVGNGALLIEGVGNGAAVADGKGALLIEGVGNGGALDEGSGSALAEGVGSGEPLIEGVGEGNGVGTSLRPTSATPASSTPGPTSSDSLGLQPGAKTNEGVTETATPISVRTMTSRRVCSVSDPSRFSSWLMAHSRASRLPRVPSSLQRTSSVNASTSASCTPTSKLRAASTGLASEVPASVSRDAASGAKRRSK